MTTTQNPPEGASNRSDDQPTPGEFLGTRRLGASVSPSPTRRRPRTLLAFGAGCFLVCALYLAALAAHAEGSPGVTGTVDQPQTRQPDVLEWNGRFVVIGDRKDASGDDVYLPRRVLAYRDAICRETSLAVVSSVLSTKPSMRALGPIVRRPETLVSLLIEAVIHGESGSILNLTLSAGLINGRWQGGGLPRMEPGERYLLFLKKRADGEYGVIGRGAGAVALQPDASLMTGSVLGNYWEMACRAPINVPQRRLDEER